MLDSVFNIMYCLFLFLAKLSCVIPSDGQHILLKSNPSYKHLLPVIPSFKESPDYEAMLS